MILILDDHPIARQGLCTIIEINKPEEVLFQASTVREAVKIAENKDIDMAFIDINLGNESGFDFLAWLKQNKEEVKTFFITSSSREGDFLLAKKMGVDAYLLKDAFIDEIICGLKVVERNGKFYSSALIHQIDHKASKDKQLEELTEREMEVLVLISQGCSNAKISEKLFISPGTTKKHVSNILGKLGLKNRMEVMLFANRNEFILQKAEEFSFVEGF